MVLGEDKALDKFFGEDFKYLLASVLVCGLFLLCVTAVIVHA